MRSNIVSMLCLSGSLLLSGCIGGTTRTSAPVRPPLPVERPPQPSVIQDGDVQVRVYEPPQSVMVAPVHSKAVVALLEKSKQQERQGDLAGAVSTIERALRLESRNAHLWNRLAHLRYDQGRRSLAADLAAKSNAIAGGDLILKRDNWQLIADSRRSLGDVSGARAAERKARMLH